MAEKTLRTKFREILSPAAVWRAPRGMHVHPATWPRTPQEVLLGLGVGEELLLFSLSYGEAEAGRRNMLYKVMG